MAHEKLEQLTISLPPALMAFVERHAKLTDHTTSGAIRHLIATAARLEVPPSKPAFPEHERVERTPAGIAKAGERLAQIKAAAGPYWLDRYHHLEQEIELAKRFLPAPANGGA